LLAQHELGDHKFCHFRDYDTYNPRCLVCGDAMGKDHPQRSSRRSRSCGQALLASMAENAAAPHCRTPVIRWNVRYRKGSRSLRIGRHVQTMSPVFALVASHVGSISKESGPAEKRPSARPSASRYSPLTKVSHEPSIL